MSTIVAYVSNNSAPVDTAEAQSKLQENCPKLLQPGERVELAFKARGGKGRDDSFFTNLRIIMREKTGLTGKKVKYLSIPYGCIKAYAVEMAGTMDSDVELKVIYSDGGFLDMDFVAGSTDIFAIQQFLNEKVLISSATGTASQGGDYSAAASPGEDSGGNFLDWMGDDCTQIDASQVESELKSGKTNILLPDETVDLAFKCGRDSFLCTSKRLMQIDVKGMSGKRVHYLSILWKCFRAFSVETGGNFLDRDSELVLYTSICGIGRNNTRGQFPSLSRLDVDFKKGKADIFAVQRFFTDKLLGSDDEAGAAPAWSEEDGGKHGSGSSGGLSGLLGWLGDDNQMIDPAEMDRQYHCDPPILQPSERVEMAFKGRRDLVLFTSKRLVLVDIQGFRGNKMEFFSLPWHNVQVFGICTAGGMMDKDSELLLWTDVNDLWWPPKENEDSPPPPPMPRKTHIEIDFKKDAVDIMAIHRYLSARCLRQADTGAFLSSDVPVSSDLIAGGGNSNAVSNFLSMLGDDARSIAPVAINEQLQHNGTTPMLQEDERVVLAYKSGRDMTIFTTKRVIRVDVKGMTGKSVEWQSIPYRSIRAFSVESAGSWDTDAEVKLYCGTYWISGGPSSVIKQDLRKGKADIIAIQSVLAAQIFGGQDGSPSLTYNEVGELDGGNASGGGAMDTFASWASGDGVEVNAADVNRQLHENPPLLQTDEIAEVCFKVGRDMMVFTTKRIILIDRQGLRGKKVEYTSYPLSYCDAFQVSSAGTIGFMNEAKAKIFIDIPGVSHLTQELSKKGADIWSVQSMLAGKMLHKKVKSCEENVAMY
jgi:hypothetical protein